jgi:glyoxylase-like metal-dependent hydrolase (beta-lactamase superfamily II)
MNETTHDFLEPIADGIELVKGANKGRFPFSHSILFSHGDGDYTLIDTGCGIEILKRLKDTFHIVRVINSHAHLDHASGNWVFGEDGVEIHVPQESFESSGDAVRLSERFAEPGALAQTLRGFMKTAFEFRECRPTHTFDNDTVFQFNSTTLVPIHTPGHTADHYAFWEPNRKIVFGLDIDLTRFGPWYAHRESSIELFKQSIGRIKALDSRIYVSSHKGVITGNIAGRLDDYLGIFERNQQKVLALIDDTGKTFDELLTLSPIYGGFPYPMDVLTYWEGQMISKHLEILVSEGTIKQKESGEYTRV